MTQPIYLVFPDDATAASALSGLPKSAVVDYMGSGKQETAQSRTSKDAAVKTHPGVLVNVLLDSDEVPKALAPYQTFPRTPIQVFAGWSPEEIAAREAKAADGKS